jgi:predicted acyltransferase
VTTLETRVRPARPAPAAPPTVSEEKSRETPARLASLDAYRGFIMLAMASAGLSIPRVVTRLETRGPVDPIWRFLAFHSDHVPWIGCSFWDLIQPSFMFMVGVALPYSVASRLAKGDSWTRIFFHAIWRAFLLILLAVFLSSPAVRPEGWMGPTTNWVFVNVLAQIGMGYVFVFLLVGRGLRVQFAALAAILVGYTLFFGLYPLPPSSYDWQAVKVPEGWPHLTGWFAHWDKNSNAAHFFDLWFLNLFPRPQEFRFNDGGYQTLNFIPSMATMILGLMAGEMLRREWSRPRKLGVLIVAALGCLVIGWGMGLTVCPLVKRIWTPSWAIYSSGWTFAMLAAFFAVIDVIGWRRWAFPLVVVGMNSIAMYCMSQLLKPWVRSSLNTHLGRTWFEGDYGPLVTSAAVLVVLWVFCLWLYRRKIFLKI